MTTRTRRREGHVFSVHPFVWHSLSAAGGYSITNESYLYDNNGNRWHHLFAENPPPPRAAHAACCVDTLQLVVFGGATGGGSLSAEEVGCRDIGSDVFSRPCVSPCSGRMQNSVMHVHTYGSCTTSAEFCICVAAVSSVVSS